MKNKVYSTQRGKQFNSILKLIEMGNKELAKRELRKILNHYYYNEAALSIYVKLLFMDGEFDGVKELAEDYLDNREIAYYYALVLKYSGDIENSKELFKYSYNEGKTRSLIQYIVILIKEENYEEAYNYFCLIPEEYVCDNEVEIGILRRYIYKEKYPELNLILKKEFLPYFSSQIVVYNERILEQIVKKRKNFKEDIDVKNLIIYAKEKIKNIEPTYFDIFDRYIIKDPGVGKINGKNTDYLVISTNLNTKDIVNIYPYKYRNRTQSQSLSYKLKF